MDGSVLNGASSSHSSYGGGRDDAIELHRRKPRAEHGQVIGRFVVGGLRGAGVDRRDEWTTAHVFFAERHDEILMSAMKLESTVASSHACRHLDIGRRDSRPRFAHAERDAVSLRGMEHDWRGLGVSLTNLLDVRDAADEHGGRLSEGTLGREGWRIQPRRIACARGGEKEERRQQHGHEHGTHGHVSWTDDGAVRLLHGRAGAGRRIKLR